MKTGAFCGFEYRIILRISEHEKDDDPPRYEFRLHGDPFSRKPCKLSHYDQVISTGNGKIQRRSFITPDPSLPKPLNTRTQVVISGRYGSTEKSDTLSPLTRLRSRNVEE